jgi:hypothetical protein
MSYSFFCAFSASNMSIRSYNSPAEHGGGGGEGQGKARQGKGGEDQQRTGFLLKTLWAQPPAVQPARRQALQLGLCRQAGSVLCMMQLLCLRSEHKLMATTTTTIASSTTVQTTPSCSPFEFMNSMSLRDSSSAS